MYHLLDLINWTFWGLALLALLGFAVVLFAAHRLTARIRRPLPRLSGWLAITGLLLAAILALAPHQLPVSLYKLSLVATAGLVGYWLDRSLFPYARPDTWLVKPWSPGAPFITDYALQPGTDIIFAAAMLRRAIIVGAAMLAMGLGA